MVEAAGFQLEDVWVRFGAVSALERVSLEIAPGSAIGFVGPSGAGKTTLLEALNGSRPATTGTVRVGGRALRDFGRRELRETRSHIGFIHQGLDLVPNLRVSQNVIAGRLGQMGFARSLGSLLFPSREVLREVYAILERVGIPEKLFEQTDRLSGGQQQRVALARALFQKPTALLADEPVSSVDPARARDMIDLLTRVSREEGLTLCMSLHNLELARTYLPRLVGLRAGRIVFDRESTAIDDGAFESLYALRAPTDDVPHPIDRDEPIASSQPRGPGEVRLDGG
ncbi:MAG: ATP-binding cassette domain-containing protein [Myxococcota bacterium]|nr:ATP-binding cassette domain-containing protein [Myxococcota bacterium]